MKILIERYSYEKKQTIGLLFLLKDNGSIVKVFDTLELPFLNNKTKVSCIPEGTYKAVLHDSPTFGRCLWLKDVPNRTEILIHAGNTFKNTEGCILIGKDLVDINGDGFVDVVSSQVAMKQLLAEINQNQIEITVK